MKHAINKLVSNYQQKDTTTLKKWGKKKKQKCY